MSLSSTLSSALTGLNVASRAASVAASNVANASVEGYSARRLEVSSVSIGNSGAGARVVGVQREVNPVLQSERRIAGGEQAHAQTLAGFSRDLESVIGVPTEPSSLSALYTDFESSLIASISRPESSAQLTATLTSATALTEKIGTISDEIGDARQRADQEIGFTVERLNGALQEITDLNGLIRRGYSSGRDVATMEDDRQRLIDEVAREIPVRVVPRDGGEVALLGYGGLVLLDGTPAELAFTPRSVITPNNTVDNGALSRLTVNGREVDAQAKQDPLRTGGLSALFELRDETTVAAQARIDAVARDLVERFQDTNTDPTLGPTEAGLFTDQGAAFDAANEVGLSRRLALNAAVDPAQGGEVWRLRDGLGTTVEGPPGNAAQLERLLGALTDTRVANSGDFATAARSGLGFASDFLSLTSTERGLSETRETYASTQFIALREEELKNGVDTDFEMQQILLIEQAYSANAKIIEVVGEMLDRLEVL